MVSWAINIVICVRWKNSKPYRLIRYQPAGNYIPSAFVQWDGLNHYSGLGTSSFWERIFGITARSSEQQVIRIMRRVPLSPYAPIAWDAGMFSWVSRLSYTRCFVRLECPLLMRVPTVSSSDASSLGVLLIRSALQLRCVRDWQVTICVRLRFVVSDQPLVNVVQG